MSKKEIGERGSGGGTLLWILCINSGKTIRGPGIERGIRIQRNLLKIEAEFYGMASTYPRKIVINLDSAALFIDGKVTRAGGWR